VHRPAGQTGPRLSIVGLERLRERLVMEGLKQALFGKNWEVFKE